MSSLRNDIFFIDLEFGDLYIIIDREPDIAVYTFLDDNKDEIKVYSTETDKEFYVEIFDDFPLYRDYRMYRFNDGYYVKVPLFVDKESDILLMEHFEVNSFLMVEPIQKYPERVNSVKDIGRLVSMEYPDKKEYVAAKKIADKKKPYSVRGKKPEKQYQFVKYELPVYYIKSNSIKFVDVGEQKLDFQC